MPIDLPQKSRLVCHKKADWIRKPLEIKRLVQQHNKTEKQVPLREPDLLIVLTGGYVSYTRPDGVKAIPLAYLKD